jgi:hypothetical protein
MAGGFGGSGFGGFPLGVGGPLSVVRALAVAGQVVRVVFSEEPLHRSAAGAMDALNPANYIFSVIGGAATAPSPVGVNPAMVVGPTYGVQGSAPERGFDVAVDRQLIVGIHYVVTVRDVAALSGSALGSPDSGDFFGVTRLEETRLPVRNQDLVDFACPPSLGHYVIDDTGDIAVGTPADGTVCRIFRRLTTKKDAFRWLRGYGVGIDLKGVASTASLSGMKNDGTSQVKLEPDVAAASVAVTTQPVGIVLVQVRAQTRRGAFVDVGAKVSPTGVSFSS